jgi:hypothetical protein
MQYRLKSVTIAVTLLAFLSSCRRDSPSWDVGIVTPLAHASMSIDNLVTDSLITADANGAIRLVYSNQFLGLNTDTLFDIPDTTIGDYFSLPLSGTLNPGDPIANQSSNTTYALGNVELVFAILSQGKIYLTLQNDVQARIVVNYQIPGADLNGVPFDTTFTVNAAPGPNVPTFANLVFDLSNYAIDFTGSAQNNVNTIALLFSAMIDPTENPVAVTNQDSVGYSNTFSGVKPFYMRGYFGSEITAIGPETSDFSFFSKIRSGSIGLDSLTMSLHIDNYLGMDARLTINNIWSENSRTGQSVYLANSVIGSPFNVNRGTYTNSWPPVTPSSYDFIFNNANSNARALVENMPDRLGYDLTLFTNPLGNVSGNNDFFFANYAIDARLDVEMPLNFFASQLVVEDTIEADFASMENKESILDGILTLHAQNSFPFSAAVQIYLLDANGLVTDSIVALPNVINSGATTMSGQYLVSSGFASSEIRIPLTGSQTQSLLNSSRLLFQATFDTNSAPNYAKVYMQNRLDLQLTADFTYKIGS